jgi:hypothetical protein
VGGGVGVLRTLAVAHVLDPEHVLVGVRRWPVQEQVAAVQVLRVAVEVEYQSPVARVVLHQVRPEIRHEQP